VAFVSGGVAAVGSSVVKVPIAVCIRSVQAGVYANVLHAARSINSAAGPRGLFTVRHVPVTICLIAPVCNKHAFHNCPWLHGVRFVVTALIAAVFEVFAVIPAGGGACTCKWQEHVRRSSLVHIHMQDATHFHTLMYHTQRALSGFPPNAARRCARHGGQVCGVRKPKSGVP
jgi:hypothetical protein